jgi:four helix bundle protein
MNSMQTFEGLECWKAARQLRLFVSREVITSFPRDERFELTGQVRRAARSVTANIAEGYGRYHFRDNYKFCSNARGSLFEVLDHLITANDEGYLRDELLEKGRSLFLTTKQLLNGYMSYLSRAADGSSVIREEAENSMHSHEFHHA